MKPVIPVYCCSPLPAAEDYFPPQLSCAAALHLLGELVWVVQQSPSWLLEIGARYSKLLAVSGEIRAFWALQASKFYSTVPGLPSPCALPACLLILQPVPNPHHSPYHPPSANHPRNPRGNKTLRFFQHCCCSSVCSIAYPGCVFLAPPGALIVRLFRDNILSRRKGLSVPNCPKWSWQILAGQWEVMRRL